jgi:hypothetical protein
MTAPALKERHTLSARNIERTIKRKSAGVYVLSSVVDGVASVRLVGRSDDDVGAHLKGCVGLYSQFAFVYASSPKNAYEMECEIYHSIKPPENNKHPARPRDAEWICPVCGQ